MPDRSIIVDHLSKVYRLYENPLDRLKETLHPFRKKYHKDFYAVYNVSFEVKRGETVGIIGKNGSGKSTLLKILTGVLTPSGGTVITNGKMSALLELGTGFNPELTGVENIYFSGTIMGYEKKEVDAKLDDVLSFADIGEYVYQPVKTYSSGMFVRLAFAVAIHVDPKVLIIDEALSVGDIAFRNKCMTRIKEMRDRGTTILFVSHDLSTLQILCDRVIWLDNGRIVSSGDPISICQEYYSFMTKSRDDGLSPRAETLPQQDTGMAKFLEFTLDSPPLGNRVFSVNQDVVFKFSLQAIQPLSRVVFAISIYRTNGDWMVGQTSREANVLWENELRDEVLKGSFVLNPICLAPGDYRAAIGAYSEDLSLCYGLTETSLSFSVRSNFPIWGKIYHPCKWNKSDVATARKN